MSSMRLGPSLLVCRFFFFLHSIKSGNALDMCLAVKIHEVVIISCGS